jgi:hypothetical protein
LRQNTYARHASTEATTAVTRHTASTTTVASERRPGWLSCCSTGVGPEVAQKPRGGPFWDHPASTRRFSDSAWEQDNRGVSVTRGEVSLRGVACRMQGWDTSRCRQGVM